MNKQLNKVALLKIQSQIVAKIKASYQFGQAVFQRLSKRQRITLVSCISLVVLMFIIISASQHVIQPNSNSGNSIQFETKTAVKMPLRSDDPLSVNMNNKAKLQDQLGQLQSDSNDQFETINKRLQTIRSILSSLPSQQDVEQLKQRVNEPDTILRNKVDHLQNTLQKIIKQTAQKRWVDPKNVEKYFQLVAVQGFSDGMRAIIDVAGNQMTLSVHDICPACRGWILEQLDFTHQSGVFKKQVNHHIEYVKLQAS